VWHVPLLFVVLHSLRRLQKLQMAQGLEAHKARQLSLDSCVGQVGGRWRVMRAAQVPFSAASSPQAPRACTARPAHAHVQVELLQVAFTSLADAVLQEMGEPGGANRCPLEV
jgi:hypothetical protein